MVVTVAGEKKTYDEGLTIAKLIEVEKVENPDYETREDKKVLMHRRIAFYQKNGMQLSGVTCNFYDNEYRIMYAGAHCEDTKVQEITMNTYLNFFGANVVRKRAVFHAL